MNYLHRYKADGTYDVVQVYPKGREVVVSPNQDTYVAWLALGRTPTEVPYVEPPPSEPTPIPADRAALYARLFALWQTTGLPVPADDDEAETALDGWATTLPQVKTVLKIQYARSRIDRVHGTWDEAMLWLSQQA